MADDHDFPSRMFASGLRELATLRGAGSRAAHCAELLLDRSEEFRRVWDRHEVGIRPHEVKRFIHPEVGVMELNCQRLLDPGPVAQPARVHGRAGQRELRPAASAVGHRATGDDLTRITERGET